MHHGGVSNVKIANQPGWGEVVNKLEGGLDVEFSSLGTKPSACDLDTSNPELTIPCNEAVPCNQHHSDTAPVA